MTSSICASCSPKPSPFAVLRGIGWRRRIREVTIWLLFACLLLAENQAAAPTWWTTQGVINSQKAADDYAAANLGQLKNMAKKAALEMNIVLPGGAGTQINSLIASWEAPPAAGVTRDDFAALTLGQLKSVTKKFYDRLSAAYVRSAGSYPWSQSTSAADDFAAANVGQLKAVFAFEITPEDVNDNSIPDLWEMQMFGNLNQDMENDFDQDGLNNWDEWLAGTRPDLIDTDGDGWNDDTAVYYGYSPSNKRKPNAATLVADYGTYDTDSFQADDSWYVTENLQSSDPDYRWLTAHSWYYLEPPGGHWLNDRHSSEPATTLYALPTREQVTNYWQTEAVGSWRWDWHAADRLGPNDFVPNGAYFPIINRWDQALTDEYSSWQEKGWGINWKRYRLRLPKKLPVDYEANYLLVTYKWDKDNAQWNPYDLWDIFSDGYWTYPEPTVKSVESVKMTLAKGETVGDWLYVCPQTDDNELLSVQLVQVEFVSPAVEESATFEMPSSPPTEPLAAGGGTPSGTSTGQTANPENVRFSSSDFKLVEELKIAKLNDAISDDKVLDSSPDPDQFVVKLVGMRKMDNNSLSIALGTTDMQGEDAFPRSDDPTEIPLYEWWDHPEDLVGRKFIGYATSPLLLVSHALDDAYKHGRKLNPPAGSPPFDPQTFGADDVPQPRPDPSIPVDRTHLAALGSQVVISSVNQYAPPLVANQPPTQTPFPVQNVLIPVNAKKTVTVSVYAFIDSGVVENGAVKPKVWSDLQMAREILAQVGVRIEVREGFPKIVNLTENIVSNVGAHYPGMPGVPSQKGLELIQACDTNTQHFSIIYCKYITAVENPNGYAGYAYPPSASTGTNRRYINAAFIAGDSQNSSMALAHELCHLLTNHGHFGTNYPKILNPSDPRRFNNLMRLGDPDIQPGIGMGCRLEQLQQNMIYQVLK